MSLGQVSAVNRMRVLWRLTRPGGALCLCLVAAAGYGWAHWDRALTMRAGFNMMLVWVAWWFLNAGTMWLNARLDDREGDVLFGESEPPPPNIEWVAALALIIAVGLATVAHLLAGAAAAVCAVMAVLYSHPRTAWKGHPVLGPAVNVVGYGMLTPFAGWVLVGVSVNARTVAVWTALLWGVLGFYFVAQAFQADDDRRRGYRTLVVTHGPAVTITMARWCLGLGLLVCFALTVVGWVPRVCALCAPFGIWIDHGLWKWSLQPFGGDAAWARMFIRRLIVAAATILSLTTATYIVQARAGAPVAGLGTVSGHPPDRPVLPPHELKQWELWWGTLNTSDDAVGSGG